MTSLSRGGRTLLLVGLVALSLAACGRRGPLELPPESAAQTSRPRAPGATTVGQTQIQAVGQTGQSEGSARAPEMDDEEPQAKGTLPSPVPTSSGGRRRGPVIPKEPFILDPLL